MSPCVAQQDPPGIIAPERLTSSDNSWATEEQSVEGTPPTDFLGLIVNSFSHAIISEDLDGRITTWNSGAERLLGFSMEEMTGHALSKIVPSDRFDEDGHLRAILRREESITDFETERITKEGHRLWVSVSASPLRTADGEILGTAFILRDITASKRTQSNLVASEERFRMLANTLPQLVWMAEGDGTMAWYNQRWFDYTGKTMEELQGDGWLELYHPDCRQEVAGKWQHSVASGTPFECECPLRGADGTYRRFLTRSVPLRDAKGMVTYWFGTSTDITERIEAEAAMRESEERFRHMADAAPVIIWLAGPDKRFNYFNKAWLDFTGHTLDEELDIDWSDNIHPEDLNRCLETYSNAFKRYQTFEMEYRLRHHTGEYRWLLDRGTPRMTEDGSFEGYIGAAIDIHDQKLASESIRKANESASRAKDEFLAALSHELRTPLSPVLMLAAAMEHSPDLPAQTRADCAMIRKNIELEARLIDDLLDLTRITRGKMVLRFENLDPHPLIEHSLEILRGDLHAKQIQVDASFCTPSPYVCADSVRLQQVFWNILKNAVKFTPSGGRITIRSYSDYRNWRVDISDTGLGITPEEMPQIFNAFSQGKEAAEPRFGGVGLGLAITAHLVHEHRGKIWAESKGRDQGATFHLEIPLAPLTNSGRVKLPPPPPKRVPLRVLLVEDHEASRVTLQRLLTHRGHSVSAASSLAEARSIADQGTFDIVISDLGLPDGSGHELMRDLKAKHRLCGIALSGYGMASDLKQSQEAGFQDHLTKPVDVNTLEQAMLRVWNASQVLLKLRPNQG
ncbi:MAG: multi-sensor hybrid histidine kinase [Verrucomicrobiaceae bacterium]|nr:multi-sensor hybrid histidine kinase [Verrucomicrobiaceae bacterium]